jgi:general secretion pathway protein A
LLLRLHLRRNPFSDPPEEGVFCSNAAVRHVYGELINALCERSGAAVLTGEAGVGKTTLLRRLRSELKAAGYLVIARYRAGLLFRELVAVLAEEIQVPAGTSGDAGFATRLREQLARNKCARPPVLIIDDAEQLGGDVIRKLGQLLVGPADRSLRILLCGRPELAQRLELPVLAELRQMVLVSHRLERLHDDDAASYIFHRLRAAGYRGSELFSSAAIDTVVAKAAGLPRQIDRLCTKSLTLAAAAGKPFVTSEIVEQTARELSPKDASPIEAGHEPASVRRYCTAITGTMGASIVVAVITLYALMGRGQAPEAVEAPSALHRMTSSWEGTAFARQAAAIPPEREAVSPEMKSGSTELIQLRLQETPQLAQAFQWAFDEPDTSPRPAAPERAPPNLLQPADPCPEAQGNPEGQGVCSNSSGSADHGNMADGGPIMPANERPRENRGEVESVAGTEPMRQAEQRSPVPALIARAQRQLEAGRVADPAGDNAVETYRQLFTMGPEPGQANDLLEEIRLALWASARNALKAGRWDEAQRFYELAVHPAIDIGDAEPSAKPAIQDIDKEVAVAPEPLSPGDAAREAGASDSVEPAAPPEMDKTEDLDRSEARETLSGEPAGGGEARSAGPLQASDQVEAAPATEASGPGEAADAGEPVGKSLMSNESSLVAVATGSPQQAASEDVGNSGSSTPAEASPQNSVAQAAGPAVMVPTVSPMPAEFIAALIKRGDELLRIGDISAARLAYERAAAGGSAQAMTALGTTYDPSFFNRLNARGIRPDPTMAAEWYRKAAALGDTAAAARISQLPALAK